MTIVNLYQTNVGREGKDGQENSGHKRIRIDLEPPFLSLQLRWRPNLGLFEPNTAHLKEKGVECSVIASPYFVMKRHKLIHENFLYVKSEISIMIFLNIKISYGTFRVLLVENEQKVLEIEKGER